jgi:GNAT superfamily N-acetyltransferase
MIVTLKNQRPVLIRRLITDDFAELLEYLNHLSSETILRFGPHSFDFQTLTNLYQNSDEHYGYLAQDIETSAIIAYSIIKTGYLEHDSFRLRSYGLLPDEKTDCTFAPSVADKWQGIGLGNCMFNYILTDLKALNIKRIILWGGVQCSNEKAVKFYLRNGFRILGEFEYNGRNYDMVSEKI